MDVRNCKKCGKLFNYQGDPVCPACAKEMEEKFFQVRQYIYDNPSSSISTVSEENDVPVPQIKKWVRQERLSFTKDSGVTIDCENCGRAILTGRYCKNCKDKMANSLSQLYVTENRAAKKKTGESAKMRFLGE